MELWRVAGPGRLHWVAFFVLLALALAAGCRRDDTIAVDRNRPPETFVTLGPDVSANPDDPVDLYYRAHLYWRGEDVDGTVRGFRWAVDDTTDPGAWKWTTETDSIFRFEVGDIGAKEHLFLIRAVDDLGKQDASPDTLRFESFTLAAPLIDLGCVTVDAVSPTLGQINDLTSGDTVEVFSDIEVCWCGSDEDGFIVGWESKFDNETAWTFHEADDVCRSFDDLSPGLHVVTVRAVDDAGAKSSNVARIRVFSNFDPFTTIDVSSIIARAPRPWLGPSPDSDLVVGPGLAELDSLPINSTLEMCWTATDIDGPIIRYSWTFGELNGQTAAGCVSTDTTGLPDPGAPCPTCPTPERLNVTDTGRGIPFLVKGIDVYENAEGRPDTVFMYVNFQPTVQFTGPDQQNVVTGAPVDFWFDGDDKDSDPTSLRYRWKFNDQISGTQPASLHPDSLFVRRAFTPSEAGVVTLQVWAQDVSGSVRESAPDMITITVTVPRSPAARREEATP
ncbi:MAG: hypothetical protein ACT4PE_11545 [Candidatus Eiseniibacteriota bacterium]